MSYLSTGVLPRSDANWSTPIAGYKPLRTKDSYLNVGIGNDRIWGKIHKLLGLEALLEMDAYETSESRMIHRSDGELSAIPQVGPLRKDITPRVEEHNEEVFKEWLGWGPEVLDDLRRPKIIR